MEELVRLIFEKIYEHSLYSEMRDMVLAIMKFGRTEVTMITTIFNAVLPASLALIVAMGLYHILNSVIQKGDNITLHEIITPIFKIVLCITFLYASKRVIGGVLANSNFLISDSGPVMKLDRAIEAAVTEGRGHINIKEDLLDIILGCNFITMLLMYVIPGLLGRVVYSISSIILAIEVVAMKTEISLRLSMMPLAIASISSDSHRGGIRYIKSLIARAFHMFLVLCEIEAVKAIMYSIAPIITGVMKWQLVLAFLSLCITGPFCVVTLANTTRRIVDEALS